MVDKKSLNYFLRCKYCKNLGTEEIKYVNALICYSCKIMHNKKTYGNLNFLHNFSNLLNENKIFEPREDKYNQFFDKRQKFVFSTYFLSPTNTILLQGFFYRLHKLYNSKFRYTNSLVYKINFILVDNNITSEEFSNNKNFYKLLNKNLKIVYFSFFKDLIEGKTNFADHYLIFQNYHYSYQHNIFAKYNFLICEQEIIKKYTIFLVSLGGEVNSKNEKKYKINIENENEIQFFIKKKYFD